MEATPDGFIAHPKVRFTKKHRNTAESLKGLSLLELTGTWGHVAYPQAYHVGPGLAGEHGFLARVL